MFFQVLGKNGLHFRNSNVRLWPPNFIWKILLLYPSIFIVFGYVESQSSDWFSIYCISWAKEPRSGNIERVNTFFDFVTHHQRHFRLLSYSETLIFFLFFQIIFFKLFFYRRQYHYIITFTLSVCVESCQGSLVARSTPTRDFLNALLLKTWLSSPLTMSKSHWPLQIRLISISQLNLSALDWLTLCKYRLN